MIAQKRSTGNIPKFEMLHKECVRLFYDTEYKFLICNKSEPSPQIKCDQLVLPKSPALEFIGFKLSSSCFFSKFLNLCKAKLGTCLSTEY